MCGLSGVAGSLSWKEERTARDLLFYNTLRGEDSTGVATLQKGRHSNPEIAKSIGPPWYLLDTKKYDKAMKGSLALIMNHNRKATVGGKTLNNAHPFQFGSVVGTHNGTIADYHIKDLPDFDYMTTDSQVMINSINEIGIEKTIKAIPECGSAAAYALVWYDGKDHTINFLRNSQRSLYFAFDEDRKNIFWSSEIEHLISATNRNEIHRSKSETAFGFIPMKHYKLQIPTPGASFPQFQYNELTHGAARHMGGGSKSGERPFPSAIQGTTNSKITWHTESDTDKGQCEIPFKETTTGSGSPAVKQGISPNGEKTSPSDSVIKLLRKARDKFPMFYRDDNCKIYLDCNTGTYHRYWWSEKEIRWNHSELNNKPLEITRLSDEEIARLISEKKARLGIPFDRQLTKPVKFPEIDKEKEIVWQEGTWIIVSKVKDPEDKFKWIVHRYMEFSKHWSVSRSLLPPKELMDTLIDIKADHSFQWRGKKTNRRCLIKGFNRRELTMDEFNEKTKCGCLACGRKPRWTPGRRGGVKVEFVSGSLFLCEFCAMNPDTMETAKNLAADEKKTSDINLNENRPTIN